jgi:glucose-1-phosphate thymidylyltransferase
MMNGKKFDKGIILAGGSGSRLAPMTAVVNKHLLPIYDKPVIYYSLTTLMLAGIRDILLISAPAQLGQFRHLMGDGSQWGLRLSYAEQPAPEGLAQALVIGADFITGDPVALILGDNVFYANDLSTLLAAERAANIGATVFSYQVRTPERYGVLVFDKTGKPIDIEEKPKAPKSHDAITGLYFFDNRAVGFARQLKKSARGEYEITDLNRLYLKDGTLRVCRLGRGTVWFDAGAPDSLHQASSFVELIETRSNLGIAFPEEIAYRLGYIDHAAFNALARRHAKTEYGQYLEMIAREEDGSG